MRDTNHTGRRLCTTDTSWGSALTCGVALGVALGVVFHNMVLGLALGAAVFAAFAGGTKREERPHRGGTDPKGTEPKDR